MAEGSDRSVDVGRDAIGNAIITGNGNIVVVRSVAAPAEEPPRKPAADEIGPNPYKGLLAFHEQDAQRFFGREIQTDRLWKLFRKLHDPPGGGESPLRLLPVLGPSGSGKSSIARAGLIPELARRPLPTWQQARVAVLTPGSHPLEALAAVLARIATGDAVPVAKTREFADELKRRNAEGQCDGLRRIAASLPEIANSPLIVLVDQLEEVYSLCTDPDEQNALIDNLLCAVSDRASHVSAVITLRTDFLDETQKHAGLNAAVAGQGAIIPAMDDAELRQAITEPARLAGRPLDDATVDLLVDQTKDREGALPLLQFALTRIWEGLLEGVEPAETLKRIGGVGGALAGEAQRIYDNLPEGDKNIARRVFLGLVQLGEGTRDTRRRVGVTHLTGWADDPDQAEEVLHRFSASGVRLITLSADPDGTEIAEITHEALFDHWRQFDEWLAGSRDDLRFQRRLDQAARHWHDQDRAEGLLWRPPDLGVMQAFQQHCGRDMTPMQFDFFLASDRAEKERIRAEEQRLAEKEHQQNRLRKSLRVTRIAAVTAGLLLTVAIVIGVIAWNLKQKAERQYRIATVQRLAQRSLSGADSRERSLILAYEAVSRCGDQVLPQAEHALRQAVTRFGRTPLLPYYYVGGADPDRQAVNSSALPEFDSMLTYGKLSQNSRWLLFGVDLHGTREVWRFDLDAPRPDRTFRVFDSGYVDDGSTTTSTALYPCRISDDGRFLAAATDAYRGVLLWVLDAGDHEALLKLPCTCSREGDDSPRWSFIPLLSISHDGKWLARDQYVWDLRTIEDSRLPAKMLKEVPDGFSRDGKKLVKVIESDGKYHVWLWHLDDGFRLKKYEALNEDRKNALLYPEILKPDLGRMSPDAKWMLRDADDWPDEGSIMVCRLKKGRPDGEAHKLDCGSYCSDKEFSADGRWLATVGEDLRIWDLRAGDPLSKPTFKINLLGRTVEFSPDGHWLASGHVGIVRLWDLTLEAPSLYPVEVRHLNANYSEMTFSNNSRWLIGYHDNPGWPAVALSLWDLSFKEMLSVSGRLAGRNLSEHEWRAIFPGEEPRKTFPDQPIDPTRLEAARALAREGKVEEAITAFQAVCEEEPQLAIDPEQDARVLAATHHLILGESLIVDAAEKRHREAPNGSDASYQDDPQPLRRQPSEGVALEAEYRAGLAELRRAKEFNPDLPLDPDMRAGQLAARNWQSEARKLAENGEVERAKQLYRFLHKRYPKAQLDYDKLASDALSTWERLAKEHANQGDLKSAESWVERIRNVDATRANKCHQHVMARLSEHAMRSATETAAGGSEADVDVEKKVSEALRLAQGLEDSDTDEIRWTKASVLDRAAGHWLRSRKFEEAVKLYKEADELTRNSPVEVVSAREWNTLCWRGCIYGHAELVEFAGEKAVAMSPNTATYHDTLGLARGILGNLDEAIKEFELCLQLPNTFSEESKTQRRAWIEAMNEGKMPFTSEVLKSLEKKPDEE